MATTPTCPAMAHYIESTNCMENFAGVGSVVYVGIKSDLAGKLTATNQTYTLATTDFNTGKGLFKIECKNDVNQIKGESRGQKSGYELTYDFTIDANNKDTAAICRALNNLDFFLIVPDGDEYQIMYDANRRVTIDSGGITTDTGQKAEDDRITTVSVKLSRQKYPNYYVTIANIDPLVEGYTE